MSFRIILIASSLLATTQAVQAEPMTITPGLWEVTITSKMPLLPEPTVKTMQQCFSAQQVDPDNIMRNSNNCEFSEVESTPTHLAWRMTCAGHGGNMTGNGSFDSSGDRMRGSLQMFMQMNGQQITMDHQWSGRRVGDCR
ncbi:MAG: DUF3617 domain-containing protein [Sedimenticola sp.]|nr:DUF3617 domain-containing protein [Sedimenticola sp.]